MNERIQELAEQAGYKHPDAIGRCEDFAYFDLTKFAELIVKDMVNELFVVYPGGKNGSDVKFQNISIRQWIKEVYGVES